jgi:hypothetical protein
VPGWQAGDGVQIFEREDLFNLVDGQAESFFAYGFERVVVRRYQKGQARLNAEIWQLASPADAFGLFTAGRTGSPAEIGAGGDTDPGRRLAFWQDRFFASLSADPAIPDDELWAFARLVSAALPPGGEPPALLARLPQPGRVERSELFFHEEMSIQMEVWLGGENRLGLGPATNGVLARYDLDGATARLVLIEYPSASAAAAGLKALQSGEIEDLLTARVQANLLGAVFGRADPALAQALLEQVLKQ